MSGENRCVMFFQFLDLVVSEGLDFILWISRGYCMTIGVDLIWNCAIFFLVLMEFWYWYEFEGMILYDMTYLDCIF